MKDRSRMQNLRLCADWASVKEISEARRVSVTSIRQGLKNLIGIGHMEREVVDGIPQRGTPFQHRYRRTPAGTAWMNKEDAKVTPPPDHKRKHIKSSLQVEYVPPPVIVDSGNPFEWRTFVQPVAASGYCPYSNSARYL